MVSSLIREGLMRSLSRSVSLVVGVSLAWATSASAVRVPGSPAKAGCYAVFDVEGGSASGKKVTCSDCDASCDIGGPAGQADGQCVFMVRYCLNDTTAAPACKAAGIQKVKSRLLQPGTLTFPAPASDTDCGAATPITVKLKKKGKKPGKRVVTLVAQGVKGTKPKVERGELVLVCTPHTAGAACPTTTTTTTTSTTTTTVPPGCGNGKLDPGEECDLTAPDSPACPQGQVCCNCACSGPCTNPTYNQLSFLTTPVSVTCGGGGLTKHCTTTGITDTYGKSCTANSDCNGHCQGGTCGPHGNVCQSDAECAAPSSACQGGPPPSGAVTGEIDDSNGNKISDLGSTCLYIGGSGNISTPPSKNPDGSTLVMDARCDAQGHTNLCASSTVTDPTMCSKGAGPHKHCVNGTVAACTSDADCGNVNGSCMMRCAKQPGTLCLTDMDCGQAGPCQQLCAKTPAACSTDADCGGTVGSCGLDANCFFGPPLPIVGPVSTCVVNVIQQDAFGSVVPSTGELTMTVPLSSRVHVVSGSEPCPLCLPGGASPTGVPCTGGFCGVDGVGKPCTVDADCNNTCDGGPNEGLDCTPVGTGRTSIDCPPDPGSFLAPLPVTLKNLTTGRTAVTASNGCVYKDMPGPNPGQPCTSDADCPGGACQPNIFCPNQANNFQGKSNTGTGFGGAFGEPLAHTIVEMGAPAGSLLDFMPHSMTTGAVCCIPPTCDFMDGIADMRGPGATRLVGTAQLK